MLTHPYLSTILNINRLSYYGIIIHTHAHRLSFLRNIRTRLSARCIDVMMNDIYSALITDKAKGAHIRQEYCANKTQRLRPENAPKHRHRAQSDAHQRIRNRKNYTNIKESILIAVRCWPNDRTIRNSSYRAQMIKLYTLTHIHSIHSHAFDKIVYATDFMTIARAFIARS